MTVRVLNQSDSQERPGSDYVRVSTCHDPLDDTVTLATIQRFVERRRKPRTQDAVYVKTLVLKQPMSVDEALGLATCYAERKNIPVVYTD